MSMPGSFDGDEARRQQEDTEAILSRRRFLIQSALAGAGIAAAASDAQAQVCLSVAPPEPMPCLKVVPPGNEAAPGGDAVTESIEPRTLFSGHTAAVVGLAVSPDGAMLASIGGDGTIRLWESGTGRKLGEMSFRAPAASASVSFSPSGTLVSNNQDSILLWDVQTRRNTAAITADKTTCAIFSLSGRSIASCGPDGNVLLWDATTRRVRNNFKGHTAAATALAFAADGKTLASASADGTARLWDVQTGGARVLAQQSPIFAVAFSPDGRYLASGGGSDQAGEIKLWDAQSGRATATLTGHAKKVLGVTFSRDGRTLASCGEDGTLRLWSVAARRALAVIRAHKGSANCVEFSRGGRTLFSAGADEKARAWDVTKWVQRQQEPLELPDEPRVCLSVRPEEPVPCLSPPLPEQPQVCLTVP